MEHGREGRGNGGGNMRQTGSDQQVNENSDGDQFAIPDIARDRVGIPPLVFQDTLKEGDKPRADHKTLEVVLLWRESVMSVAHYDTPRPVTIGDDQKSDFRLANDGFSGPRFHLLDAQADGFVVNWTSKMAFEVRDEHGVLHDAQALSAQSKIRTSGAEGGHAVHAYTLGLHDRVAVRVGEITFVIQYVSPARIMRTGILKTMDYYFTKVLGLSFLAHVFLLLALLLTPLDPDGLNDDLFKNPNRFAQLLLTAPEKTPPPKKQFELSGAKGGAKHKDEEGKFGKPQAEKKDAMASVKGAPRVDPNKREKDRQIALESGIFSALKGDRSGAASNVLGPGGLGTGINTALGGLGNGTAMGDAGGAGGLGTRGTGPGGGGSSLGIGGFGGSGSGTGRGRGGLGNVDLGGRGKDKYTVVPGRTITKGCLTQEAVLRVINRVQSQAKYCYEKELTRFPDLAGKIVTSFVIGATGAITKATIADSSMGNPGVENCLLRVIERLRFPPCAGGGVAEVTYPWIFKSGGN